MKRDNWFKPADIMYGLGKLIGYGIMLGVGYAIGAFLNGVVRACIDLHLLWF